MRSEEVLYMPQALLGPSLFWLIAAVVLLVVEAVSVGLTSIWFSLGAVAALIVSFFTPNIWIQIGCFLAVSFLTLFGVRPAARRFMASSRQATNADRVIGAEGVVVEAVDNLNAKGQVKVNGSIWTARAQDDTVIPPSTLVRVDRIEGVKLIVTPLPRQAAPTP